MNPYVNLVMSLFSSIFANELTYQQQQIFSEWAGLPPNSWSDEHRDLFALTFLQVVKEIKRNKLRLSTELTQAIDLIPANSIPRPTRSLTDDIRKIYLSLFVGS